VSAFIYLEGGASGANSNYLNILCEKAFHKLLDAMDFVGRKPRLVACGARSEVYKSFRRALRDPGVSFVAMWIDSEEPMTDIEKTWQHLAEVSTVEAWQQPPNTSDDQVLMMTTCMETWIVADRDKLRQHYSQHLNENSLPHSNGLESRNRHEIQRALVEATKNCKNSYSKGKKSFEIFEKLDPSALRLHLPSFGRIERILGEKFPKR
jgi:hypothetical protein